MQLELQEPKTRRRVLSKAQILIEKMLAPSGAVPKTFWPREMKIANKILLQFSWPFWEWLSPPYGKPLTSLSYFIAAVGQEYLQQQYLEFVKNTAPQIKIESPKLEEKSIGEDVVVQTKPRTLKDFLNIYVK